MFSFFIEKYSFQKKLKYFQSNKCILLNKLKHKFKFKKLYNGKQLE